MQRRTLLKAGLALGALGSLPLGAHRAFADQPLTLYAVSYTHLTLPTILLV